jgi:hypothetical protein
MPVISFQVGDRVRVRRSSATSRADKLGTIVQLYLPEADIYDVELDDDGFPKLMLGRELERLDDTPEPLAERQVGGLQVEAGHPGVLSPLPDSARANLGSETS